VWKVVATVLHLCNVELESSGDGETSKVKDMAQLRKISKLIETSPESIADVLTHRHVATRGEAIKTPINQAKALYARDALAKVSYVSMYYCNFCVISTVSLCTVLAIFCVFPS